MTANIISGKPYTLRGVCTVWEGVNASPFRRMSRSLPHDCSIFLGGKEPTTLKELATSLGKETIDTFNTGESRGREVSHSLNYQKLGKELMSVDELAVLDGGKCILQLRGVRPFLSDKYDITKHPNYKLTADFDERNTFDAQEYLQHRLKLKGNEVCNVYQVDMSDEVAPQNINS